MEDGVEVAEEPVAGRVVAAGAEVEAAEEGRDPAGGLGRRRVDEHALLVVRVQRPHPAAAHVALSFSFDP